MFQFKKFNIEFKERGYTAIPVNFHKTYDGYKHIGKDICKINYYPTKPLNKHQWKAINDYLKNNFDMTLPYHRSTNDFDRIVLELGIDKFYRDIKLNSLI